MQLHNLSRRRFLQGSAVVGASGLLIGCSSNPVLALPSPRQEPEGEMHEWLFIGTDNKIIMTNPQTEMGQGVNTALPQILADELDADWDTMEVRQAPFNSKFNNSMMMQMTGGSMAVAEYYTVLRQVGAGARLMILKAAAAQLGTSLALLKTEKAHVIYNGKAYPYGQFADSAASLPAPDMDDLVLKTDQQFNLIGQPVTHRDTHDRITGQANFGIDVQVPNMLNATVIHAPIFGAKPVKWDEQTALSVKGVKQVVAIDHALIIIAEKYWQAKKAAALMQASFSNYTSELPGRSSQELEQAYAAGLDDKGKAKVGAAHVIDVEYKVPFLAHVTMEPMNATAWVQPDRIDLWIPSQAQTVAVNVTAALTGMDAENIHIHNTLMGGGFGRRGEGDFVALAVAASIAAGQPVKVTWSREEDVQHDMYRPMVTSRLQVGLDEQFRPVAWHNQLASTSVMRRVMPIWMGNVIGSIAGPMTSIMGDMIITEGATKISYLPEGESPDTDHVIVDSNIPVGAWRSVGHSSNAYFTESVIDEAAHMANQDPYKYRSQLLTHTPREKAVLDLVAKKANWGQVPSGHFQGIAVEFAFMSYTAMVVEMSIENNAIKVHRVTCAVDCGKVINPNGAIAQIEGGINFALSATMQGEISIEDGRVEQSNFHDYPLMRLAQSPVIDVHLMPSNEAPTGLGEVGVPPLAPALCNALVAAGEQRVRSLPLSKHGYRLA